METAGDHTSLLSGLRNGDENSVRELYSMYYRSLCYFAEKLVLDKNEAEDIAVDTFLKLLKKKADFDNLPDIKSFLFTATRNACFDFLRRTKLRDKSNRELEYLSMPDEQFGERELINSKVLQVIYEEVEKLPNQCRQVFKSVFFDGKSTALVANEMGISTQTVLNQKNKALQILRLALYKEGLYTIAAYFSSLLLSTTHASN